MMELLLQFWKYQKNVEIKPSQNNPVVVYVNFCKDIFIFEAATASEASINVLLHNGVYVPGIWPGQLDIYLSAVAWSKYPTELQGGSVEFSPCTVREI